MVAGDVDVRFVQSLDQTAIDAAITNSITATSTDAALAIMPINMGQGVMIVTVARS